LFSVFQSDFTLHFSLTKRNLVEKENENFSTSQTKFSLTKFSKKIVEEQTVSIFAHFPFYIRIRLDYNYFFKVFTDLNYAISIRKSNNIFFKRASVVNFEKFRELNN
jgi:hypothetical protein